MAFFLTWLPAFGQSPKCVGGALSLSQLVDPYRSCACQRPAPRKTKTLGASGFAPEASVTSGLPLHSLWPRSRCRPASGANPQPKVRIPVLGAPPGEFTFPPRPRGERTKSPRALAADVWAGGRGLQHPQPHERRKRKRQENIVGL